MSELQETRAERMARYKEERRRQLAAQFNDSSHRSGKKDGSSSSSEGPRMTRTSRLRAAAAAATAVSDANSSPAPHSKYDNKEIQKSSAASSITTPCDSPRTKAEKDKSSKRKSNLNRSLASEEITSDTNDDNKTRRRRRRFFSAEVLQKSFNPEDKLNSDASLTASNQSPLSSPITASTTIRTITKKSELSVHMENARKSVTSSFSDNGKSRTPPRRTSLSSPKERSPRHLSDFELNVYSDKEINGNLKQSNKENIKRKTDETNFSRYSLINRKDKSKVPNNSSNEASPDKAKNRRISKRMDELTALTRETLARVERLANKNRESPKKEIDPRKTKRYASPTKSINGAKAADEVKLQKKKSIEDVPQPSVPVSILKRKVSQDESKSVIPTYTPPVTFSPSVIEPATTNRKQGILKKRRSLDESQVMRHRSCSPDVASKCDSKSILKNQRRSSLEEITRLSADSNIQGILKRKTLKNEEELDSLNSPQGILKRRSGASSAGSSCNTHHHVSITTAVILAAAEGAEMILDSNNEAVKPILKKKSISEESEGDSLKPILKKKSSTDTDDGEDKPKRPILKLSRNSHDGKELNDLYRYNYHSANESGSECEVKPILKSTSREETPRLRLSFCADGEISPPDDEEISSRRRIRRTIGDFQFMSNGPRDPDYDVPRPRVISVSELVMNFEKSTGAIPKKSSFKRNSDRCRTQPITFNEFEASLNFVQSPQREEFPRLALSSPVGNNHNVQSLLDLTSSFENDVPLNNYFSASIPKSVDSGVTKMSSDSAFQSLGDGLELENEDSPPSPVGKRHGKEQSNLELQMKAIAEEAKNKKLARVNSGIQKYRNHKNSTERASLSRFSTQPITLDEVQEAARIKQEEGSEQNTEAEIDADPSKLSLSERIQLFNKKQSQEKLQIIDVPRRRTRFTTQPITSDELETARTLNTESEGSNLSRFALDTERRGILKPKFDLPLTKQREKSRSPPPKSAMKRGQDYTNPRSILKSENSDFTYDEGISSNDSDTDSEIKIVITSSENENVSDSASASKNSGKFSSKSGSDQTSDESSGGREIQSIIGREAMMKRRQMRDRSNDGSILKSKSQTTVGNECPEKLPVGVKRSNTTAAMRRSIGELQAKLQQSGDNDWRKRLPKLNNASEELNLLNVKNLYNDELSEKSSILKAKKDELDASAKQWKSRVEKSDAISFSVAGRMQIKDIPSIPINIPTPDKIRRTPKAKRFKGKEGDDNKDSSSTPVSPDLDCDLGFTRSISVPSANFTDDSSGSDTSLRSSGRKVTVARPDDDTFKSFFKSVDVKRTEEHVIVSLDDFDCVTRHSESLLVQKKNIKVQRRRGISKNPVKVLAARSDIQNEYTEIITGVAERETKRLNVEKLAKNSNLAVEALAGLASKEDFAAVALKKSSGLNISYLPFKTLMLLHVKGRRHVQTRLVEPVPASINQGDNYILITPNALYNYIGPYSNVIEQSRAADIINHIQQTGDMGCKIEKAIVINTKKGISFKDNEKFWSLLGSETEVNVVGAGHPDEDEVYETTIIDTNMIYCVENEELVPLENYWGTLPKIEILQPSRVLVFDYGSEMYVWSGKNADPQEKRVALKLAKELWDHGYNYSECVVCPLNVAKMLGDRERINENLNSESRPEWALFAKITQHRETVLFREKFLDWPDYSRVIKVKDNSNEKSADASFDIKPCDVNKLNNPEYLEPDLEIEGSHLGRGRKYFDEENNRNYEINTLGVTCWVIFENTYEKLEESVGHFYDGDSYIVRWQFRVTVTGRELSGKPSKHAQLGRDRCIYFCWLGKNASINEKGAAALLTVELDSENARQIRISQGSETPVFLQLFNGKMFIHQGKRDTEKENQRLYICRGEIECETVLVEVPCSMRSLRSRTSFIFVENDKVTVWNGCKSLKQSRDVAKSLAEYICSEKSVDFNFESDDIKLDIIEEGKEDSIFFDTLGEKRQLYRSLLKSEESYEMTPRIFRFSSISGCFEATELFCPYRNHYITPYPFLQIDLYSANQPALFLIDNDHELWLWQGWWPERENDSDLSEQTGSGAVRWQAERRAAMQTAVDYWKNKHPSSKSVPAYLVWAGLEPLNFTNLFPVWYDRDDIAELNIKEGRKAGDQILIEKELALLTRTTYPLAELLQRPLPDGVDPTHLEIYLSPEDFTSLLSITKEEFQKLPAWKQTALKKEKGLF